MVSDYFGVFENDSFGVCGADIDANEPSHIKNQKSKAKMTNKK